MDENNNEMQNKNNNENCYFCKHPVTKHILIGLMVFLGAFAAFYVVADWHYKRMFDPIFQMRKMDHMIMKEARKAEKIARRTMMQDDLLERKAGEIIHTEKTDDAYKIMINLRPFDNDEKNIEVTSDGNKLTVTAAGETKKRNKNAIIRFTQSFIFPEDADLSGLSKFKEGDKYVIIIPLKEED